MESKICSGCRKVFFKNYHYSKNYWKRQRYCSIKCSRTLIEKGDIPWNKGKKGLWGKDSYSYKGGRNIAINGYVRILVPGTGSYKLEHRLVMEKILDRSLETWEVVHHKNHNRQDNREENLELIIKNEHDKMETKNRWDTSPQSFRRVLKCPITD